MRQATSSSVRAALRISTCPRKPSSSMPGLTARIRICRRNSVAQTAFGLALLVCEHFFLFA